MFCCISLKSRILCKIRNVYNLMDLLYNLPNSVGMTLDQIIPEFIKSYLTKKVSCFKPTQLNDNSTHYDHEQMKISKTDCNLTYLFCKLGYCLVDHLLQWSFHLLVCPCKDRKYNNKTVFEISITGA